ncbi:hypothetical protein MTsPCn3_30330 [Erythrobacter sp. MTPC3]
MAMGGSVWSNFSGIRSFGSQGVDLTGSLDGCRGMMRAARFMTMDLLRMRNRTRESPMGNECDGKQNETEPLAHSPSY